MVEREILADEPDRSRRRLFVRAKIEMAELEPEGRSRTALRAALDVEAPTGRQARFVLGSALMLLGDQHGARAELARAVDLDPAQLEARRALARSPRGARRARVRDRAGAALPARAPRPTCATRILVAQSLVNVGQAPQDAHRRSSRGIPERAAGPPTPGTRSAVSSWPAATPMSGTPHLLEANERAAQSSRTSFATLHLIERRTGRLDASAERIARGVQRPSPRLVEDRSAPRVSWRCRAATWPGRRPPSRSATELEPRGLCRPTSSWPPTIA